MKRFFLILFLTISTIYPQICRTKAGHVAAPNPADYRVALVLAAMRLDSDIQPLIDAGRVFELEKGLLVYVEREDDGLIYIRTPMQLFGVWTDKGAVEECK